jgi:alkylhydroperoxidase/carboxymuconolactone decarboxylase family protein YurZ
VKWFLRGLLVVAILFALGVAGYIAVIVYVALQIGGGGLSR